MNKSDLASEATQIATRGAPPITVAGLSLGGVQLQDWVYILTIIWLVFQITSAAVNLIQARSARKKKAKRDSL